MEADERGLVHGRWPHASYGAAWPYRTHLNLPYHSISRPTYGLHSAYGLGSTYGLRPAYGLRSTYARPSYGLRSTYVRPSYGLRSVYGLRPTFGSIYGIRPTY